MKIKTWKCGNGETVKIKHMSDKHLGNCINYLYKQRAWLCENIEAMTKELSSRAVTGKHIKDDPYFGIEDFDN